ncbi:MAG: branched-chain amino acid transport permease [Deltaproteobacteria bacterium]|jgi:branched-chain amino acid transport system permease protein|nr:branched-chain amino acid transport permease [Deltaproteobacteria bacterium]
MEFWVNQTFNGLSYAALLFLLGGGFTLIFGVMKIANIAHGSFYLVGGYVGYTVSSLTGNFYLALLVACIVITLMGMVMERLFLHNLGGQDLRQMLITMGIALFLQDLCLLIWGGNPLNLSIPSYLAGSLRVGKYYLPALRIFMIISAALLFALLYWFQEKTKVGAMVRASVDNMEMSEVLGINVPLVTLGVFGLGALLAGFGGVVGSAFMGIYPGLDFELLPLAFVVVIIGGMGSLQGALVGSIIVGLVDNFGKALFPELSYFTLFAPMAIILALRPTGLFGKG